MGVEEAGTDVPLATETFSLPPDVKQFHRAILYHGSGAESRAEDRALKEPGLLVPPVTGDPLGVQQIREVLDVLGYHHPSGAGGNVLIGPLDRARWIVYDSLLKTLEEIDENCPLPILWCRSTQGLPPTLLSRCRLVHCEGEDENIRDIAGPFWRALVKNDLNSALREVEKINNEEAFVLSLVENIRSSSKKPFAERMKIWEAFRNRFVRGRITRLQIAAVTCELLTRG